MEIVEKFFNIKKLFIVGDLHFSEFSSIIRKKGQRLKNCIDTLNWVEETASTLKCDSILYLGDFFDKPTLNAEELTALSKVKWADLNHYCLVGNHELGDSQLNCSSTHILNCLPKFEVIDAPTQSIECCRSIRLIFLPYIVDNKNRKLTEYIDKSNLRTIIFSHNDIKGIQMGPFISKEGFDIKDIEDNCDLFINGHLHNGADITDKIINLGNITGQNFSEDAFKYSHNAMVLDIETGEGYLTYNPYAFNFYKVEINDEKDFSPLFHIRRNAVLSIKCKKSLLEEMYSYLCDEFIAEKRVIIIPDDIQEDNSLKELISSDHIKQFRDYIINQFQDNEYVLKELQEVL